MQKPQTSIPTAPNIDEALEQSHVYYDIWDKKFIKKLSELPSHGEAKKQPYTGHWYPERFGGTNRAFHGQASALHRYDQAFNSGQPSAVNWEKTYHNDTQRVWVGHCNGYAAAAQRYPEPINAVTRNGVVFSPQDIKTLLAEVHLHVRIKFLGGRRCEGVQIASVNSDGKSCPVGFVPYYYPTVSGISTFKCLKYKPKRTVTTSLSDCEDVNPATFHLALANWIGKRQQVIIFDKEAYNEVWNYPLYKYYLASSSRFVSKEEALRLISQTHKSLNIAQSGVYPFNPAATQFYYVYMHAFRAEVDNDRETVGEYKHAEDVYTYILELDAYGEIVGGEWLAESYHNHPDFLWIALEPVKSMNAAEVKQTLGITNPAKLHQYLRGRSNPYVDPREVNRLWAESSGLDPNTTPPTLVSTTSTTVGTGGGGAWGRYEDFDLLIDGGIEGTVFLGKKIFLDIIPKGNATATGFNIKLNGASLSPEVSSTDIEMNYTIAPRSGINVLHIGQSGEDAQEVIFHAVPP